MVHLQVLQAVTPVVHGPEGSYSIQLQLAPNDLGQVQVTVDMSDGQVSIHLHADDPAAGVALRDSLPQLREQLEQQGLRTGSLDVGSGDAQRRPPPQNTPGLGGVSAPGPAEDPILPTRAAHPAGALDVRL
jgi:flagellar hook-length control protein FliK